MIHRLPAWGRTLRARVVRSPKLHVTDSGPAGHLLGLTESKLARAEPAAAAEFGHLLETFCVNEILKQLSWADESFVTGHWRTHEGQEVDLVIERRDGTVVGVEVKASGRLTRADSAGLRALRESLGSSFHVGILLQAGEHAVAIDDRILALPIDRLWFAGV